MAFSVLYGEQVDRAFLDKLDFVDTVCYEEKYWGEMANTVARWEKNRRSFVFVVDNDTGNLAGYINFFPCEEGLYLDNLSRCPIIRDDDITADEVAPWRETGNHVFVLSLAIHPKYQGGQVIKLLSNSWIRYMNRLEGQGFPITDIMGTAVSADGRGAMKNYLFRHLRDLADGNAVYICDGPRLDNLLGGKLYFRSFKDDLYLMLPLAEHEANLRVANVLARAQEEGYEAPGATAEEAALTEHLMDNLREMIAYECSNEVVADLEFVHLGSFDFLHTTDDYEGREPGASEVVMGTARGHAVLAAHRKTHMFVMTVLLPAYPFSVTQMEDQLSCGYLKIRDPRTAGARDADGATQDAGTFIFFADYLRETYGLHACGQGKCVLYLSDTPDGLRELEDMLAAEAFDNYDREYVLASPEISRMATESRSQFSDYDVYLSDRAIVYITKRWSDEVLERVEDFADYLFIVILTLFQNTALSKVNMRVTKILESGSDISPRTKLAIDREYGATIRFWEMQNFKYLSSQLEAAQVKEAFGNAELKDVYREHQEYLEHLVSVKAAITEARNGMIINVVAIILAVIEVQPFFVELLQAVYGWLGIEATYAPSTINYGMFGGVVLLVLVLIINGRRRRFVQKNRM